MTILLIFYQGYYDYSSPYYDNYYAYYDYGYSAYYDYSGSCNQLSSKKFLSLQIIINTITTITPTPQTTMIMAITPTMTIITMVIITLMIHIQVTNSILNI